VLPSVFLWWQANICVVQCAVYGGKLTPAFSSVLFMGGRLTPVLPSVLFMVVG
jgi:hypothetical protein